MWLVIQWLGNGCILAGSWALSRRQKACLVYYSLGNLCWISYAIHAHVWAMLVLDLILTALNVKGWLNWELPQ